MSKGVLLYALNNEQIDYVKLAVNVAKNVKKYLNVKSTLVTDSADWLYQQYPDWQDYFDFVIRLAYESGIEKWHSSATYPVGSLVYYNGTIWRKVNEGPEFVSVVNEEVSIDYNYTPEDFDRIYEGIDIDKWYPNLPYLKGQHVWYENILYRCDVGYTEKDNFSKERYSIVLENVKELNENTKLNKGDIVLKDRVLWLSNINNHTITNIYDTSSLERVYQGIDIDKWYPNLPYLKGQHVWYKNTLYRCNNDYQEQDEFSFVNYDLLLENVFDLSTTDKFLKGTILLHNRVLWLSKENCSYSSDEIRFDLWEDTKERFLIYDSSIQYRRYFDGSLIYKRLKFKNDIRIKSFEISPYDETLVLDCDYLINNDVLKYCWEQPHDFLIFKDAVDLTGYRNDPRLKTVSDKSIDFYWATVFFFKKNSNTEIFFNYLGHIQENWNYYRHIYQIEHSLYRNDYAFSIGIHVMNGYQNGDWAYSLPGKLYYTTDRDLLLEYNDSMKFLIEKENYRGEYTLMKVKNINVHVMNKFSLSRVLDDIHNVEYSL